jgi:hypothetical protein
MLAMSGRLAGLSWGRAVAMILAIMLMGLGLPQTLDSLLRLYSRLPDTFAGTANIHQGPDADRAEALLRDADDWTGDPDARISAGILERRLAVAVDGKIDTARLKQARDDLESGLARAPANALAWAELSIARLELGDIKRAAQAWRTSILLASYEPSLDFWRTQIGLRLWLVLNAADRNLLNDQINFSWGQDPTQVIDFARGTPFAAPIIRRAFADDPKRLSAFDAGLETHS